MKFCPNCGTQLLDDAKFCFNCGSAIADTANVNTEAEQAVNTAAEATAPIIGNEEETCVLSDVQDYEPTVGVFNDPVAPTFNAAEKPAYQPPEPPVYQPPVQPTYQQPAQPTYQQPAQPAYQQPAQPTYQQPAAPTYQYAPQAASESVRPKSGLALPILAIVFSVILIILAAVATNSYIDGMLACAIISIILVIPTFIFALIGLIKSIKGRRVIGIVFSAISLAVVLYIFFFTIGLFIGMASYL